MVILRDIWEQALPNPVRAHDILSFLHQKEGNIDSSHWGSLLLSSLPPSLLSGVIDQASTSVITEHTFDLSFEMCNIFPIVKKSNLHIKMHQFLRSHTDEPFEIERSLPSCLNRLKKLSLLGRTIYGYDSLAHRWVAYKFLKVGETQEELIRGECIHRFFVQIGGESLAKQTPLGLFQTEGLPEDFFLNLFPNQKETINLMQLDEKGEAFYRKYAVHDSKIFHYTYENSYSFQKSSEGIWASLREASFFWLHRIYFHSVASFFHNSLLRGRRYFTGILFFGKGFLGKLNHWNAHSTNHSDFRIGGLADMEDYVGEVTQELDDSFRRASSYYNSIFDKEKILSMTILCDYLLLADLLTFRKYLSIIDQCVDESEKLSLKADLIKNIQMNYVTVWSSLTGDSEELSKRLLSDTDLFSWEDYVEQFLKHAIPDVEKTKERLKRSPLDIYKYGLTYSGHFKETLTSEGINLGDYNGHYPVTHFVTVIQRFFILLYKHREKYFQQAQKADLIQKPFSSFKSSSILCAS